MSRVRSLAGTLIIFALAALCAAVLAPAAGAAEKALLGQFGTGTGEGAGKVTQGKGVAVNRAGVGGVAAGSVFVANDGNARVDRFSAEGVFVRAFGWDVVASGDGDAGANETQTVSVRATGGSYTLSVTTATAMGTTTSGSATLTKVSGGLGQFRVGDAITGTGIAANTTVTCVSPSPGCTTPETLTISQAATSTGDNRVLTGRETTAAIDATAPASGAGSVEAALSALPGVGVGSVAVTGGPGSATGVPPYSVTFSGGPLAHDDLPQMTGASALVNPLTGGSPTTGVTVATTAAGGGYEVCEVPGDQCKAGVALVTGGSVNGAEGIAVDQDTGNVFVASNANRRIDVFSATGTFQGAFGRGVVTGGTGLEFCTTTCLAGVAAATSGAFATNGLTQAAITVSPDGVVYVGDRANRRINEFALTHNGSDQVTGVSFTRAFGWGVRDGAAALQTCTTVTGCVAPNTVGGNGDGQFPSNTPTSIAVDDDGQIYAVASAGTCSAATNPCRVQVFNPDGTFKQNFGPADGGAAVCQLTWTSGHWGGQGPNGIAIDPDTQNVYVSRKDSSDGTVNGSPGTFEVCEFDSDGTFLFRSPATSLPTNNNGYLRLAVGQDGTVYANAPIDALFRGAVSILDEIPPPGAEILPTTNIGQTAATLNGRVIVPEPGGDGFEPVYRFEYSGDNGLNWIKAPVPDAQAGTSTPGPVEVSEQLSGLEPNRTYRVRLVATIGQSTVSGETTFTTEAAKPTIKKLYVLPIGDTSATLRGTVNPNNSHTNYQFEYGITTSYGNEVPAFQPYIGNAGQDQKVSTAITGLVPDTTYHYRLAATNETGTTYGPNRTFTTHRCPDTNTQGLAGCRAFELVSPADQGPIGQSGNYVNSFYKGFRFQIDPDGDSISYPVGYGLPGQTAGGDVNYRADRAQSGWQSKQLIPDAAGTVTAAGTLGDTAKILYLSEDLDCGFITSHQKLAPDAPSATTEAGDVNFFRSNPDGSYTTITTEVPVNLTTGLSDPFSDFEIVGASEDCGRVVFSTPRRYAGPGFSSAPEQLYEWDHGVLRAVGVIPGAPDLVSPAGPGGNNGNNYLNAVSSDAARVFFTGSRSTSSLVGEVGKEALFVREDGTSTVDVSLSETAVVNQGADFQDAAEDGSKVLFLANYGLADGEASNGATTSNCASSGAANERCDLYSYDLDSGDLTDLTETTAAGNPNGAVVAGILDSSDDGETVYFVAQGQLVPREGNTYAQNTTGDGAYNIYRAHAGGLSFVAVVSKPDVTATGSGPGLLMSPPNSVAIIAWGSRATPDGRHLVFQSTGNVTGYDSGGVLEAYRYSADSDTTVCVSCRKDGQMSVGSPGISRPLPGRQDLNGPIYHSFVRTLSDDGSRVVFSSQDALAPGGVDGDGNLYEWHDGQISLIYTYPTGGLVGEILLTRLVGMSANGKNVFFTAKEALVPQDQDSQRSVYVARVDGGFGSPSPGPGACDPLVGGSCQAGGLVPEVPLLATALPAGDDASPPARERLSIAAVSRRTRAQAAATGVLALRVTAPAAGRLRVTAKGRVGKQARRVALATVRVGSPGPLTVRLRLNTAAKRSLRLGNALRLTIQARQAGVRPRSIGVLLPGGRS